MGEGTSTVGIAIGQFAPSCGDIERNIAIMAEQAREAVASGAEFIVFPEICTVGFGSGTCMATLAENAAGPTAHTMRELARQHGIAIGYGYPELAENAVFNSYQVISRTGDFLANHRKTRLFGDDENAIFKAADAPPTVCDIGGTGIAVLICYEIMFPELSRLAAIAGADILLYPSAGECTLAGPAFNRTMTAARAIENGVFVAYPNCCGSDGSKAYRGQSVIVGPDGAILAEADEMQSVLYADLRMPELQRLRRDSPYLKDRRAEMDIALRNVQPPRD